MDEYKKSLDSDKKNLLRVIDELSSLNEWEYRKMLNAQQQQEIQLQHQRQEYAKQMRAQALAQAQAQAQEQANMYRLNEYNTNDYDSRYTLNNPNNSVQIDSVVVEPPFTE